MAHINIHRLELRFKGVPPHLARTAVAGLGTQVLRAVAQQQDSTKSRFHTEVGEIEAGPVHVGRGASPATVRETLAGAIARAVTAKLS